MKLKDCWSSRTWDNVDARDLVLSALEDAGEGGALERLEGRLQKLAEIVARLIEAGLFTDTEVLDIIGTTRWELPE